jgi:hypothetical protein
MPVDFKSRPTVNGVNIALLSELSGGVSGNYSFTPTDAFERHRVTDSNVLSTSKIVGKILRPDQTEVDDYGWQYDFNVVKVANGYFDIQTETSLLGESADPEFGYNSYLKLVTRSGALGENGFGVLNSAPQKIATFTPLESGFLNYIDLYLFVVFPGIPTDNVKLSIQTDNAGAPSGTSIMVSKNVILVNREHNDRYKFIFEQRIAIQSKCWLVLERTGALSDSDHYGVQIIQDAATSQYGESVYIPDLGGWFSQNLQGFNYIASYHRSLFDESPTLFYKIL